MTQKTVCEFAMQSETDLRTAILVAEAVPDMKRQIVSGFLQELHNTLASELRKGWRITEQIPDFFGERWARFAIWKDAWDEKYLINLEGQNFGRETILGVWRDRDGLKREPNPQVLERFRIANWPGRPNRWWEWYVRIPASFGNLNEADALTNLRFNRPKALSYFKQAMLKAATIAEPLIDKMSKE